MADAAAARREARRRKILENSQNRLQFISGKTTCEVNHSVPVIPVPSEEPKDLLSASESSSSSVPLNNNGVIVTDREPFGIALHNEVDEAGDNETVSDLLAPLLPQAPQNALERPAERLATPALWEQLVANKYDVVLLSLLLQLLYSLWLVSFDDVYFFLPLAIYTVMKSIWFPSQPNSTFAKVLLLLNGFSTSRVQRLIQIAQVVVAFSQDVCVFLFTTICSHALYTIFVYKEHII